MSRSAGGSALFLAAFAALAIAGDPPPRGVVRPLDPATNPSTPEKVALGAKLFSEKRLSKDGTVSCSTCHVAALAFTDGRAKSVGIGGRVVSRNAPTILNAALNRSLFWDGRAASLEEQARMPIFNVAEMGMEDLDAPAKAIAADAGYVELFRAAFGEGPITTQRIVRAIAAFERTLVTGDSPFDRWWAGDASAMDDAARRGYELFVDRGGCVQCHSIRQSYALFTDGDFHNTGAGGDGVKGEGKDDVGRFKVTRRDEDRGAFRTPSLRNVALTAPYMHDGSLATLEDVVAFYVRGGEPNPHLSPLMRKLEISKDEEKDLVAFMNALTSPVLPQLEDCDRLLAEGRPAEAFDAFRLEVERRPDDVRAWAGLAKAAVAMDDATALATAESALRRRVAELSPDRSRDGAEPLPTLLFWLGRVNQVLSRHDDATAPTRQEDAITALRRARDGGGASIECLVLEARMLEEVRSPDDAREALDAALAAHPGEPALVETRANVAYRSVWQNERLDEHTAAQLRFAADELDGLAKSGSPMSDESALYRAYAAHRLGETDRARAAYADAAARPANTDRALKGLRNVCAKDLTVYVADLEKLRARLPDSPSVLLFTAYEALQAGRLDDAERDLLRRRDVEPRPSAATHYYLAQVAAKRGERTKATSNYAVALALEPKFPKLVAEYEKYIRDRELRGFDDVDALVVDYRQFLDAGPDDPEFQVLARNNLGFTLREVAASFSSRGPARIHTFAEGAPQKAKDVLALCVAVYEEAVALVPDDAEDLPFRNRWDYAAVLNDTGLMHHYFTEARDFARAEELYLRAFDLTEGSFQDAYFYNLQFLYGFELTGRDEKWLDLARVAKDAILREDAKSPTGFSPDEFKRRAARADFERLSAKLRK